MDEVDYNLSMQLIWREKIQTLRVIHVHTGTRPTLFVCNIPARHSRDSPVIHKYNTDWPLRGRKDESLHSVSGVDVDPGDAAYMIYLYFHPLSKFCSTSSP